MNKKYIIMFLRFFKQAYVTNILKCNIPYHWFEYSLKIREQVLLNYNHHNLTYNYYD